MFMQAREHDELRLVSSQFQNPKIFLLAKRDLNSASPILCVFLVLRSAHCPQALSISQGKDLRTTFGVCKGGWGWVRGRPHLMSGSGSRACVPTRLRGRARDAAHSSPCHRHSRRGREARGLPAARPFAAGRMQLNVKTCHQAEAMIHLSLLSVSCSKVSQGLKNSSHKSGI